MCGELAKQALERLVKGQDVTCKGDQRDRYKRLIAVCYVGTLDLNERMVTDGWALAHRRYSMDYVRAETLAKFRMISDDIYCQNKDLDNIFHHFDHHDVSEFP
jgi:endonuclease YncB( thermonuclease family)